MAKETEKKTPTPAPTTGGAKKLKIKNTLSQTVPTQLFKDGKLVQRNLTRKETFEVTEGEISPAMQSQIDSGILKVRPSA